MMIGSTNNITLAYNNLSATNRAMEKTSRALSTGLKAATAADDAAGFAMSMNISANLAGVSRAIRNTQDGISMLQTAEGGLNQINSMLQRMRELTIQAANDTLTIQDRNYIQMEIDELRDNVNNIASNTTFNSKRLLDGSSSAVWSSDNDKTMLKINGALTAIDQFSQRKSADGNYRIEIKASAGQGQVQKSSPMIISHKNVAMDRSIHDEAGIHAVKINNLPQGHYRIAGYGLEDQSAEANITSYFGFDGSDEEYFDINELLEASVNDNTEEIIPNASILFEVTNVDNGAVKLIATSRIMGTDGTTANYFQDSIFLNEDKAADLSALLGIDASSEEGQAFTLKIAEDMAANFKEGCKFVYNITASDQEADTEINISGSIGEPVKFNIDTETMNLRTMRMRSFYVDGKTGETYDSEIDFNLIPTNREILSGTVYADFEASVTGQIPEYDVSLRDINTFYNAEGMYMFEQPQNITITQGDGKQTSITVYAEDTLEDLRAKLNSAIADGLGQALYADNKDNFVSFVREDYETSGGSEAVAGTFVIRSAIAGNDGKITLSSDNNDLINALGVNTITDAQDNTFTASVYDAHTGKLLAGNISTEGNSIYGVISPNAEIEFDSMANVKAVWNDKTKSYDLTAETGAYNTTLHISDKSTAFQVGARDGEDIFINIADMRAEALGLNRVDVSTRNNASESISVLDAAIRKVSLQRTRIGAYQNELEYNSSSLTETSLHLQESESRIKDADMATEMMEFIKLQILSNTGNSMLAQANQNSQAVMNILGM